MTGNKIKLSSKTHDGLSYVVSGSTSEKSDDLSGELSVKAKYKEAVLTAKLFTTGSPTGEIKHERVDPLGRRTSVTLTASEGKATAKAELLVSRMGMAMDTDLLKREVLASAAAAIAPAVYAGFVVVGVKGLFNLRDGSLSNTRVAASLFDGRESELTVEVEGKAKAGTVSYSHLVRAGMSVAGEMKYTRETGKAVATLGTAMKLDNVTAVKGKLDTTGLAALSYIQSIRPNTKVVMSTSFDVTKFNTAKVGLSLTLE